MVPKIYWRYWFANLVSIFNKTLKWDVWILWFQCDRFLQNGISPRKLAFLVDMLSYYLIHWNFFNGSLNKWSMSDSKSLYSFDSDAFLKRISHVTWVGFIRMLMHVILFIQLIIYNQVQKCYYLITYLV